MKPSDFEKQLEKTFYEATISFCPACGVMTKIVLRHVGKESEDRCGECGLKK